MLFFKKREITLGRVRDKVTFREGEEILELRVDSEAGKMMAGLKSVQVMLDGMTAEDAQGIEDAAEKISVTIFGKTQADKLREFYGGDAQAVIRACGAYTRKYLLKRITKVQEKAGK